MKVLVTGASGFLGSKIALQCLSQGHEVSLLLRPTSSLKRLGNYASEFKICYLDNFSDIQDFVSGVKPNVVVHTACSYGRQGESLLELSDVNYRLGLKIMQAMALINRPFTFINTGSGIEPDVNFYAMTKHHFSQTGHLLAVSPGAKMRFINILLEHMYGPGDDESKFTTHVIRTCSRNELELNLTVGTQRRDFIYIDDVVSAYSIILDKALTLGPSVDIEVGFGKALSVKYFVETAQRLAGASTQLNFGIVPLRPREPIYCQADISQMRSLGWEPKFDIESGIKKTLELETKL